MREKVIEEYLRDKIKALKGKAYKFVSPGNAGVPDRLILLPGGKVIFVELKAPGKTSTPLQISQQKRIAGLGFTVYKDIDSKEKVNDIIKSFEGNA